MSDPSRIINDYICCASKNAHIVYLRPLVQACGRYACESCIKGENNFYCHSCKVRHDVLQAIHTPTSVIELLNKHRNDFDNLLMAKAKYDQQIDVFDWGDDDIETELDKKYDELNEIIERKVRNLKEAIDLCKNDLFEEIKNAKRRDTEKIHDAFNSRNSYNENDFVQYERRLNQLKRLRHFPSIKFSSGRIKIKTKMIGELLVKGNEDFLDI